MKIKVIDRNGKEWDVDAEVGMPIETAISQAGIENSFGICGGACACASCQVYVSQEDYDQLQPTSRLSCQVEVTEQMEGMTFTIAPY